MVREKSKKITKLILSAIIDMNEKSGSTLDSICEYLCTEHDISKRDIKRTVKRIIDRGISFGAIRKRDGKFLIGDIILHLKDNVWSEPKQKLKPSPSKNSRNSSEGDTSEEQDSFERKRWRAKTVFPR